MWHVCVYVVANAQVWYGCLNCRKTLTVHLDVWVQDTIEVKKDSERLDAVRAMKQAWEEVEPGRAAKAKQSRLNYLSTHIIKVQFCDVCHECAYRIYSRISRKIYDKILT